MLLAALMLIPAFSLLPNLIEAKGAVKLDGNVVADINTSLRTYVELPLIPGTHRVETGGKEFTYHLFDVNCTDLGKISCSIKAVSDIVLNVSVVCNGITYRETLKLKAGETKKIGASCRGNATVRVGDWTKRYSVVTLFKNSIKMPEDGAWVYVFKDKKLILKKYGKNVISFPELDPGRYDVIVVDGNKIEGKLLIENKVNAVVAGYALSALTVLASLVFLLTD